MNKDAIKIVKRNKKDGAQKELIAADASKVEKDDRHKMANLVNNWISERRENSRAEKVFFRRQDFRMENYVRKFLKKS